MNMSDRVMGVIAGIISIFGGGSIISSALPTVTIWSGFSAPTARWVGWISILLGLAFTVTNILGLFTDRKKRLADLARCKARREQEAEAAKVEIAKNEDNQHP